MRARIGHADLAAALKRVAVVVPRITTTTAPIVRCVRVVAEDDMAHLRATDLAVMLDLAVPATVGDRGSIALSARDLAGVVGPSPRRDGGRVDIEADPGGPATVTHGLVTARLETFDPGDFPSPPADVIGVVRARCAAHDLRKMVRRVLFAIAREGSGIGPAALEMGELTLEPGRVSLAGADGFVFARASVAGEVEGDASRVALAPRRALERLRSLLPDTDACVDIEDIEVTSGRRLIAFAWGGARLISAAGPEPYPDYRALASVPAAATWTFARADLAAALGLATRLAGDIGDIGLSVGDGAVAVRGVSVGGEGAAELVVCVPAAIGGAPLSGRLARAQLAGVLAATDAARVSLSWSMAPGCARPGDPRGALCVVRDGDGALVGLMTPVAPV